MLSMAELYATTTRGRSMIERDDQQVFPYNHFNRLVVNLIPTRLRKEDRDFSRLKTGEYEHDMEQ